MQPHVHGAVSSVVEWPKHRNDSGFFNPWPEAQVSIPTSDFIRFTWWMINHRSVPAIPEGHVRDAGHALAAFNATAPNDAVTWLGHASFLLRLAGITILIDPFLSDYASPFSNRGPRRFVSAAIPVDRLPQIDVLLISHDHYDHLDDATIRAMPNKDRVTVVVPLELRTFFRKRGYSKVIELDWGDAVRHGDLTVTATPALHFSGRHLFDRNQTLWTGFSLVTPSARVFYGGDSAYGSVFREIGRHHGPFDLALIGIGAYEPQSIMKSCHTTPEEAVQIGRDVDARTVLGMHWGTVMMTPEPPFEAPARFQAATRAAGYRDENAWLLKIGETRYLASASGKAYGDRKASKDRRTRSETDTAFEQAPA